jgi:hypothetical protein
MSLYVRCKALRLAMFMVTSKAWEANYELLANPGPIGGHLKRNAHAQRPAYSGRLWTRVDYGGNCILRVF